MRGSAPTELPPWAAAVPAMAKLRRKIKALRATSPSEPTSTPAPAVHEAPASISDLATASWLSPRGITFEPRAGSASAVLSPAGIEISEGPKSEHFGVHEFSSACHRARQFRLLRCTTDAMTPPSAAAQLLALAASGSVISVDGPMPSTVAHELGTELTALLENSALARGIDLEGRVLAMLRAAHTRIVGEATGQGQGARPQITVLLATRRARYWPQILDQLALQRDVDVVVAGGVHGLPGGAQQFGRLLHERQLQGHSIDVDGSRSLGQVLNRLVETCDTEFVAKMDDDDWYGEDHLSDLAMAERFSAASIVGKAAEFIGFENQSWLVRRLSRGAYASTTLLAGGSLFLRTRTLQELGGFRNLSIGEDQQLVADIGEAGGSTMRIHGHGYVLRRHADSTWKHPTWKFLRQADSLIAASDLGRIGFGPQVRAVLQDDSL